MLVFFCASYDASSKILNALKFFKFLLDEFAQTEEQ